jgi:hypothetical protein
VLDEALQHLDGEGCARAAALLRGLEGPATVLLVAQPASLEARAFKGVKFDAVGAVVKRPGGGPAVEVGGGVPGL